MGIFRNSVVGLCLVGFVALSGCRVQMRAGFDSPDPQERVAALTRDIDSSDLQSIPDLIETLDSVDPAARLIAIQELENRTDKTFGYRHFDPPWVRGKAVDRWSAWWRGQQYEQQEEHLSVPDS
jgi:hypothetical protein